MRSFLLPFYLIRLILATLPSLVLLTLASLPPLKTLIATILVVGLYAYFLFKHGLSPLTTDIKENLNAVVTDTPSSPGMAIKMDTQSLRKELQKWKFIEDLQPSHRDTLYNLSLLYKSLGENELAVEYLGKSYYLDPNHQMFLYQN